MEKQTSLSPKFTSSALCLVLAAAVFFVVVPTVLAIQSIPGHYANTLPAGNAHMSDIDRDGIGDYIDARPYEGNEGKRSVIASMMRVHGSAFRPVSFLNGVHTVVLETSMGDITMELYADAAPMAVTNFIELAKEGFYDGLTFHRVIKSFMIQGGGSHTIRPGGNSIYGESFPDEKNDIAMNRGVVAMANRGRDTNSSQFFIIQRTGGTPWLQGKHTAFGIVLTGMDVVDAIANVAVGKRDKPLRAVTFTVELQ